GTLIADNPEQQERIALLKSRWAEKLAELQETIALRKDRGFEAAGRVVLTNRGKELMGDIRRVVTAMEDAERTALNRRVAESTASLDQTITALVVATTVALLLVIFLS